MTELLHGLAAVALFALPGAGLAELFPGLRAMPLPRRLGYGYLLGICGVAGALYVLSHLLGVPLRRPAILAVAAVPIAAGLVSRALRPRRVRLPRLPATRFGWLRAAVLGAAAIACAGLFAEAITNPIVGWDARMTWADHARYLRDAGTVDPAAMTRGQWFINHPRYPLLLPVAQVAVLETLAAGEDDQTFRAFYAALLPAFLLILHGAARRWVEPLAADLTVLAAAALPFLTFYPDGGASSVYSDMPVGLFAGAGLTLLLMTRPLAKDGIAAGLLLGGAVLTKNEGTLLAGFALITAVWVPVHRLRRRPSEPARRRLLLRGARVCAAAAVTLLAVAFFAAWRSGIPNRQDEMYESFVDLPHLLPEAVARIPVIAPVLASRMSIPDHWWEFWWVALAVLAVGNRGLRGRRAGIALPLLALAVAPLAIGWGAYAVHWNPVELAKVTWERFLVQGALPLLLLFALALRAVIRASALSRLEIP
jgi:hypothetical protein